jgi:hypothetical protein
MPRELILGKLNYISLRILQLRKEGSYYKECDKPALLVVAYNIRAKCYTKDGGDRKRKQDPSYIPLFRACYFALFGNVEKS